MNNGFIVFLREAKENLAKHHVSSGFGYIVGQIVDQILDRVGDRKIESPDET